MTSRRRHVRFPSMTRAADGRMAVAWEDDRAGYEGIYLRVRGPGAQGPGGRDHGRAAWSSEDGGQGAWRAVGSGRFPLRDLEVWNYANGPMAVTRRIDGRKLAFDKK